MEKYKGQCRVEINYAEHVGPVILKAGLELELNYSDHYSFTSKVTWPEDMDYDAVVEKGVIDALMDSGINPELGVSVVLQEVRVCPVGSSESLFYKAAKACVIARLSMREGA